MQGKEKVQIRGLPHDVDAIRALERMLNAEVVLNYKYLLRLDDIAERYREEHGKYPPAVKDEKTGDIFRRVVARAAIDNHIPIETVLWFRLKRRVVLWKSASSSYSDRNPQVLV